MDHPHELSFGQASQALASGAITSHGLCASLLQRCGRVEGEIGAFLQLDAEAILAAATASDRRRSAGDALGPYDGVPVALKDNLSADGQSCTCGSRILEGYCSPYDATVVARLVRMPTATGLIVVRKTSTMLEAKMMRALMSHT